MVLTGNLLIMVNDWECVNYVSDPSMKRDWPLELLYEYLVLLRQEGYFKKGRM